MMFRSLITLLLLTGLGAAPLSDLPAAKPFSPVSLLDVASIPLKKPQASQPIIEAKAALLMDMGTGTLLFEQNARQRLPMASLTKIMTAVLILESHSLNDIVTIQDDFASLKGVDVVRIWLNQYEKMTVRNLLIALLVPSAADAAVALATYHSGSVEAFVYEMNQKAKALHLQNTHFTNPIGIDDEEHYSSAFDLAILTKYALRNQDFRQIVQIPRATVTSVDGRIKHEFEGTNYLLNSYLDIRGVKTGTTDAAGQSLINLARNSQGREVIAIFLNSTERFQESKRLIDWTFRNFLW